jgi:hypothetical protein
MSSVTETNLVPSVRFEKPPLPLVWLDTWVILRIAKARAGELDGAERAEALRLHELLLAHRDADRILCPETGQLVEIEAGRRLVEQAKTVLSQVSGGAKTHFRHAQDQQVYRAMRAFAHGLDTVELVWADLFVGDPIRERRERDGLLIRVDFPRTEEQLAELRTGNRTLALRLEELRQRCVVSGVSLDEQIEREYGALIEATIEVLRPFYEKLDAGTAVPNDFLRYIDVVGTPRSVLSVYLQEATGEDAGIADLIRFYRSPYYRALPSVRIIAELYAAKITGTEVITPSDAMDINQLGAVLPYATCVVTDASFADKLERLRLHERHAVRVLRRIADLVGVLDAI